MRHEKRVRIGAAGRDHGKCFLITEMSAFQAEEWANRALFALGRSGIEVPENIQESGAAGLMTMGIRALAGCAFADAKPLMDELMSCAQYIPDPTQPKIMRPIDEEDIEEVKTIYLLKSEVIELHTGFSMAAALSGFGAVAKEKLSSDTSTSTSESEPSSEAASAA